jgi:hypothetical protein
MKRTRTFTHAGVSYDFTKSSIASLLTELRSLARNHLPTNSPHAQFHKDEIIQRGMPPKMIEWILDFWAEVERAGADMTITQRAQPARTLILTLHVEKWPPQPPTENGG